MLHDSKAMSPNGNLITTGVEGTGIQFSSTDRTEHMPLSCVCEKPINTVGVGEEESRGKLGNNKGGRLIPEHPGDI